jgi:hypothetical protein
VVRFLARARALFSEAPRLALWLTQPLFEYKALLFLGESGYVNRTVNRRVNTCVNDREKHFNTVWIRKTN